ncbi:MAG: pilus assembly protein [Chloroflexi bacterium]|nr:pilus assembly protein [Chloroflexota bacterium]
MKDSLTAKLRSEASSESGQGLVESGLVFGVLMVIVLALIDFAFIFQAYIGVVNAADVGAAYGASSPSAAANQAGISSAALADQSNWSCASPIVTSSTATDAYGYSQVQVTVRCQVSNLIAIQGVIGNVQVSSTAVRRVLQ